MYLWENATEATMHSTMRTANSIHYMCVISNCQTGEHDTAACQVKRWEGMEGKREEKRRRNNSEETADISDICSWFSLHLVFFFFFHYLTMMGKEKEEEGTKALIKMKDCNNSPTTPIVITSVPLPSVFLDVLTRRNDMMHRTV